MTIMMERNQYELKGLKSKKTGDYNYLGEASQEGNNKLRQILSEKE